MFENERYQKIMEILEREKKVSVNKLVKTLYVSPATVRRDLASMSRKGLLKRTYGGAILYASSSQESAVTVRENINKSEKISICSKCLDFIKNNQSIFLDSSSTVTNLVDYLNERKYLTIITTGLTSASLLTQKTTFTTYIPGGFIKSHSNSLLGEMVTQSINKIHTDLFIFSCSGFSLTSGVTEANIEQAEIKKAMARNAQTKILLVDSSKIDKVFLAESVKLEDLDVIITDKKLDPQMRVAIIDMNIKVVECEK